MIDTASGVEALIRPYISNRAYTEYEVPLNSQHHVQEGNARYIEAVTNERYCIIVKLPATFDFKGCSNAKISIAIDGTELITNVIDKSRLVGSHYQSFASRYHADIGDGLKQYGLSFSERQIVNNLKASASQGVRELSKHGSIAITILLGSFGAKIARQPFKPRFLLEQASKEAVIEHGKSHSLKSIDLGSCEQDKRPYRTWTTAPSDEKAPLTFTFYYMSREFLVKEKILPSGGSKQPLSSPIEKSTTQTTLRRSSRLQELPRLNYYPESIDEIWRIYHAQQTTRYRSTRLSKPKPKRKLAEVTTSATDDCDDEEPLPVPQVKDEASLDDDDGQKPRAGSAKSASDVVTLVQPNRMPNQGGQSASQSTVRVLTQLEQKNPSPGRNEKARKKARLMLELEEIRIKKELLALEEEMEE